MTCSHRRRTSGGGTGGERGETLMELLTTVILMSIAILALMTAMSTLLISSRTYRASTRSNLVTQEAAESIKAAVGAMAYVPCAKAHTAATGPYYPALVGSALPLPTGWTARITRVRYNSKLGDGTLRKGTSAAANQVFWGTTCTTDAGLQEITVTVTSRAGRAAPIAETVLLVKRNQDCFHYVTAYENADGGPC